MWSHTTSILFLLSPIQHTIQMSLQRVVSCATLSIKIISSSDCQQINQHLFPSLPSLTATTSQRQREDYRASLGCALRAMASTATAATCTLASPSLGLEGRAAAATHCVGLPPLHVMPNVASMNRPQARESWKSAAYCRKIARNVAAMATGDAPAEVATELPEIVKTIQDAWDKVEDKYAITSIGVAGVIALWGSTGMISAIDRLPLVPGILELVGIGYTGWFAYRNLIFKPDREALIAKIKSTYTEIIGG